MQSMKIFVRIIKFLGKVLLGLVLIVLIVLALIHLPPVQQQITRKLSAFLSSKLQAQVDIQKLRFSLRGNVSIEGLAIWDPDKHKILSAKEIEVTTDIFDLLAGNYILDEVRLSGVEGKLIQSENGLNIRFIIDAFKPDQKKTDTVSRPLNLQFRKVLLENILLEFTSVTNGISVSANLGKLICQGGEFSTQPLRIKADLMALQRTKVNTLSTRPTVTTKPDTGKANPNILTPDFGTGIAFEFRDVQLEENDFSFHRDEVMDTRKFDPAHLSLKHIQIRLSDVVINKDTLTAALQNLSVQLPGFSVTETRADVHLNHRQVMLSGVHIASGPNKLDANLVVPNDVKSAKDHKDDALVVNLQGQINPVDFAYFLSDSLMKQFSQWDPVEFTVEGSYRQGNGKIKTLNLKTGSSRFHAEGMVYDLFDPENISWKNMVINAQVGPAFKKILAPYLSKVRTPSGITLQVNSSGSRNNIVASGRLVTDWGNARVNGQVIPRSGNMEIDANLKGEKLDLGKWLNQSWIGSTDFAIGAKGTIGRRKHLAVNGIIQDAEIQQQEIHDIAFQGAIHNDSTSVAIVINDPDFTSEIDVDVLLSSPMTLTSRLQLDSFKLGRILHTDSALAISMDTNAKIIIDSASLQGTISGNNILLHNQRMEYVLDTLDFHALVSPKGSEIYYNTDYLKVNLSSNFDVREAPNVIRNHVNAMLNSPDKTTQPKGARTAQVNLELENASFLKFFGIDVVDYTKLKVNGAYDEAKQEVALQATSGKFKGYGISLDSLQTNFTALRDSVNATVYAANLNYQSIQLGNLDVDLLTAGDTATSAIRLANDSVTLLGWRAGILRVDTGALVYTGTLQAFGKDFNVDPENPVFIGKNNLAFHHFQVNRDNMEISLDGDMNYFDVFMKNVDLTPLNLLVSADTTIINKGHLTGHVSYSSDQQLDLKAGIDSLSLYNSNPLTVTASAMTNGNRIPFSFLVTNTSNKIDLGGSYFTDSKEVNADLSVDINNPDLFEFLVSRFIDGMSGSIKGKATISGPLKNPLLQGSLRFVDLGLTTVNPKLTFYVEDDSITLKNSSLLFNNFTLYDTEHHPLTIQGDIRSQENQTLTYDLHIKSDQYALINNPDSTSGRLRGQFVIDSDIKLKGDGKDTNIAAKLNIKDDTHLTMVAPHEDIVLLQAEGIIDFVDPAHFQDTTALEASPDLYDSLIASLPDFNLNATVSLEENAVLRLMIDEQSGDYISASGSANLELGYDRTGNLQLAGNYTIKKGVYRLSFYDLVKKNFTLTQGSSVNWHGSPKNGDLNIKAVYTVESNSLGLIGHEIGENEKSIYKRSLDYQVGINISGTIEKPLIAFSLDLPQNDKTNYPVLANKLDRLRQPEYASELNKQVFGLLVLGGFLPESSADVNSSVIATTALANSVNSLLAGQLNRFASQYIKGVNIDVGIQSFSDYSAPGGKTQTAMDFRVSKRIMNDRLSFEIGGDFNINQDQSGGNTGTKNYHGDIAIIYDLTGNGDKQLKLFNNETYDIIYQEIRNTGISLIFIRELATKEENKRAKKNK